jgi:glutamate synthase (NADPH) small chain
MGDPRGFMKIERATPTRRPVDIRIQDWKEVYQAQELGELKSQAARCMDCGIPFCHSGCPLGNLIPEWNDLMYRGDKKEAIARLHATNNFPEFTGRLCPAPCETACVVGISGDPVTIKQIELRTVEEAFANDQIEPEIADRLTGKTIAVIGSGPAGLAAAQQLTRAGHTVVTYERADKVGGLLRYGIPEFKMEKSILDRRIYQLQAEGVRFRTKVNVGVDITADELMARYDAILLTVGATARRDIDVTGRQYKGIYQAMDYLPYGNRQSLGEFSTEAGDGKPEAPINAAGKRVVILGGGDTGADCLGTAIRQGAKSVTQIEIMPRPSEDRPGTQPWPTYPMIFRISSAHEEGGERLYALSTNEFVGDAQGNLTGIKVDEVKMENGKLEIIPNSSKIIECDLVFLAMGFTGPEKSPLINDLGLELDQKGNIKRDQNFATNVENVFVAGDAGRGQSLIVWAIAEGRSAAAKIDHFLMGETQLPAPISPTDRPLTV